MMSQGNKKTWPSDQARSTVSAFTLARSAEIIRSHGAPVDGNRFTRSLDQIARGGRVTMTAEPGREDRTRLYVVDHLSPEGFTDWVALLSPLQQLSFFPFFFSQFLLLFILTTSNSGFNSCWCIYINFNDISKIKWTIYESSIYSKIKWTAFRIFNALFQ